jgi:hypothetical protein
LKTVAEWTAADRKKNEKNDWNNLKKQTKLKNIKNTNTFFMN